MPERTVTTGQLARPYGEGRGWLHRARKRRAARALERQLAYQQAKSRSLAGREQEVMAWMRRHSRGARQQLERVRALPADASVLEVGSGAHGLIFFFDAGRAVGLDPLATEYASLFPAWQRRVATVASLGERVPFRDGAFDVVLCDNVLDHANEPRAIMSEIARLLAPAGLLYFTVNVHHPIYRLVSSLHGAWNALGLSYEIGPFADHTVHLTLPAARALFRDLPLRIAAESVDVASAKTAALRAPRHLGDRLKHVFFKNARLEIVAVRE